MRHKTLAARSSLFILVALVAVGQMAQTIYVPAINVMADTFHVHNGALQKMMAAYLMMYGGSQLVWGPVSDVVGRRPVILAGMTIFMVGTLCALLAMGVNMLVLACAIQGVGTGVAGVMARTMPRDLYAGTALRQANSLLNMGILVSPLLAPLIGALLTQWFGWRACFLFLLLLCMAVTLIMACRMPETCPKTASTALFSRYRPLIADTVFLRYLIMLVGALGGIAVYEACSGVLMGGVLHLNVFTVSVLFILPIPAAFFGAWFAGREGYAFRTLMWYSVSSCLLAGILMWLPAWFGVMNVWTLLLPASLFFFGAGMLFPLATSGAMEPYAWLAGSAGALIGGLQNLGSGVSAWLSAMLPQNSQFSLGLLMFTMALFILLCWWSLTKERQPQGV